MNRDEIEHVSYSMLEIQVSPSAKYLLIATDKDRLFVIKVMENEVLKNFYGHTSGAYSQPRIAWHSSEKYIISNSEDRGELFVWCVASEKIAKTLKYHTALIRDLCYMDVENTLFSVSYDKTLRVLGT